MTKITKEMTQKNDIISDCEQKIQELKNQVKTSTKSQTLENDEEYLKTIQNLKKELKSANEDYQNLTQKHAKVLIGKKELEDQYENLREKNFRQNEEMEILAEKLEKSENQLKNQKLKKQISVDSELKNLREKNLRQTEEMKILAGKLQKSENQLKNQNFENSCKSQNRITELEAEKISMNSELKNLRENYLKQTEEMQILAEKLRQSENQKLEKNLSTRKKIEDQQKFVENIEISTELNSVKNELRKLQEILVEKEKELVSVKLADSHEIGNLKSEICNREAQIHEVELTLELEKRKMEAFEEHISYLKEQISNFKMTEENQSLEKSRFLQKFKENFSMEKKSELNSKLIQELKEQLRNEQHKLRKSQNRITELEAEKISMDFELENLREKNLKQNEEMEILAGKFQKSENQLMNQELEKQLENSSTKNSRKIKIEEKNFSAGKISFLENIIQQNEEKIENLHEILEGKEKVIQNLEEKLSQMYENETFRRDKELRKLKLRYEVMARLEVNQKLSEINAFLEKRAEEQSKSDLEREKISEQVQSDLSERLQQSRSELQGIKQQMRGIFFIIFFFFFSKKNFF